MKRGYICNRFPFLKIGKDIWFHNGLFETEDPALQKLIESNDSFGVTIHFRDAPEEEAKVAARLNDEKMQGGYKTDKEQNATRKVAKKIGLNDQQADRVVSRREDLAAKVREAIRQRQSVDVKEQEAHG